LVREVDRTDPHFYSWSIWNPQRGPARAASDSYNRIHHTTTCAWGICRRRLRKSHSILPIRRRSLLKNHATSPHKFQQERWHELLQVSISDMSQETFWESAARAAANSNLWSIGATIPWAITRAFADSHIRYVKGNLARAIARSFSNSYYQPGATVIAEAVAWAIASSLHPICHRSRPKTTTIPNRFQQPIRLRNPHRSHHKNHLIFLHMTRRNRIAEVVASVIATSYFVAGNITRALVQSIIQSVAETIPGAIARNITDFM